jgi:hypothetical protein
MIDSDTRATVEVVIRGAMSWPFEIFLRIVPTVEGVRLIRRG